MKIHIHIERLVLAPGTLAASQRHQIDSAIAAALGNRLSAQAEPRLISSATPGSAPAIPQSTATRLGERIAREIHGELKHEQAIPNKPIDSTRL